MIHTQQVKVWLCWCSGPGEALLCPSLASLLQAAVTFSASPALPFRLPGAPGSHPHHQHTIYDPLTYPHAPTDSTADWRLKEQLLCLYIHPIQSPWNTYRSSMHKTWTQQETRTCKLSGSPHPPILISASPSLHNIACCCAGVLNNNCLSGSFTGHELWWRECMKAEEKDCDTRRKKKDKRFTVFSQVRTSPQFQLDHRLYRPGVTRSGDLQTPQTATSVFIIYLQKVKCCCSWVTHSSFYSGV